MSHNQKLHEIAKFLSGLILGDFICLWWLSAGGYLPMSIIGITWTQSIVAPGLVFDAVLFIILVHYGWHIGKTPKLNNRTYFSVVGTILGLVALLHLFRLFTGVNIIIAGWQVPLWLSWVGTIVAAYLSYMSFRLTKKSL